MATPQRESTPPALEVENGEYIGIDLHRHCFTVGVRWENGRNYLSQGKREDLPRFTQKLRAGDEIAVEMTGNTRFFQEAEEPPVAPGGWRWLRTSAR